jgi:hypothetical protein
MAIYDTTRTDTVPVPCTLRYNTVYNCLSAETLSPQEFWRGR